MPCTYSYLQDTVYKRLDGAVGKTVLLKEFDDKVEGSSPNKTIFCLLSQRCRFFCDLHVCRKTHVLIYYAHVKRLHSVKRRSLYGDAATMQELPCTGSARSKKRSGMKLSLNRV